MAIILNLLGVHSIMKGKKGSVQSFTVFTISIISLLALATVILFYVTDQIRERSLNRKNAQEIAEYGMMIALKKIEEEPAWTQGFSNIKYKGGYYSIKIVKNDDNTFKAISTGFINNVKKGVICTYKLEYENNIPKPKIISWKYM